MIVRKYVTPECSQSVTIHPNGDQAHGVVLHDVNGVPVVLMGYVFKNGKANDTVIMQSHPKSQSKK